MRFAKIFTLAIVWLTICSATLIAQEMYPLLRNSPDIPDFYYDAVTFATENEDSTRLELHLKVPYDELQFIHREGIYIASYEVSLSLFNESGDQADGRIWSEEIRVNQFDLTNSKEHFNISKTAFNVHPDNYKISIGLMDTDTRKSGNRRFTYKVPRYNRNKLSISSIMLVEDVVELPNGEEEFIPAVKGAFVSEESRFKAYFEIYGVKKKNVHIRIKVQDTAGKIIYVDNFKRASENGIIKEIIDLKRKHFKFSSYILIVEASEKRGKVQAISSKHFRVRWLGMSETISNLDAAVQQLRYILTKSQYKEMTSDEEAVKRKAFSDYWKRRDPTPETDHNELMIEYYRRVAYTNDHFSVLQDGWKSDMGMIFILFGMPNDIDRHPFDLNTKPYEVWYYYDLNRSFVFQDLTGFGDYRLVTPVFDYGQSDF